LPALLADRAQGVRWAALEAIAEHLPPEAEEPLAAYLARKDLAPGALRIAAEAVAALTPSSCAHGLSLPNPHQPASSLAHRIACAVTLNLRESRNFSSIEFPDSRGYRAALWSNRAFRAQRR
jgi:HEAT repeat protein